MLRITAHFLLVFVLSALFACQQSQPLRSEDGAVSIRMEDDDETEGAGQDDTEEASEVEIVPSTLPSEITLAIDARYPGARIREADKLSWPDGNTTYDVEISYKGETIEAMFDASGAFLGEEED